MAVYAAHLTRTLQGTPSIFQVTAQEALGATVKPALQKVVEYLAALYPNKCGWCKNWYDELFLLFDACLQYHYLKHYAASFSESFYGLLRVPINLSSEFNTGQHLPLHLERASLIVLVLLPYLKDKVESLVEKWREDDEDGKLGKDVAGRLRRAASTVYSTLHTLWWVCRVCQLARYTCSGSRSPSPSLALLGLALSHAPPRQSDAHEHSWTELGRNIARGDLGNAAVTFPMLGSVCLRGVEYGAFVVQFLRWWDTAAVQAAALPAPTAPQRDERSARYKNKCPLCLQCWKIPTVLPVSGYIFCYTCISRHVRSQGSCPVSRCPAAESSLVRLYVD